MIDFFEVFDGNFQSMQTVRLHRSPLWVLKIVRRYCRNFYSKWRFPTPDLHGKSLARFEAEMLNPEVWCEVAIFVTGFWGWNSKKPIYLSIYLIISMHIMCFMSFIPSRSQLDSLKETKNLYRRNRSCTAQTLREHMSLLYALVMLPPNMQPTAVAAWLQRNLTQLKWANDTATWFASLQTWT